jgi:hypothetical protein
LAISLPCLWSIGSLFSNSTAYATNMAAILGEDEGMIGIPGNCVISIAV